MIISFLFLTLSTALFVDCQCQGEKKGGNNGPVAFTARFSWDNIDNGVSLGKQSILRFNKMLTNIGNAYDPRTGIFAAPVDGIYVFTVSIMGTRKKGNREDGNVGVVIETLGTIIDLVWATGGEYHQGSQTVTTNMTAGQQLYVRQHTGTAVRGGWSTQFSGFLL